jgi:hypothetical protein
MALPLHMVATGTGALLIKDIISNKQYTSPPYESITIGIIGGFLFKALLKSHENFSTIS